MAKRKQTPWRERFKVHPAAELFPMMTDQELDELGEDIKANGLREPVVFWRDNSDSHYSKRPWIILDGRNRLEAMERAEIKLHDHPEDDRSYHNEEQYDKRQFRFLESVRWRGSSRGNGYFEWQAHPTEYDDPAALVMGFNIHRRHLTTSQRSMIAVELKNLYVKESKARRTSTLKRGAKKPVKEKLPEREDNGQARDKAGAALNVSGKSVDHAANLKEHGCPELIKAVEAGKISVSKAAKIAKASPHEIQMEEAFPPKPIDRTDEIKEERAAKPKPARKKSRVNQMKDLWKECTDREQDQFGKWLLDGKNWKTPPSTRGR